MLRNNAMLKREMLINTKLPLGVAFGDFESSKQDFLVRSLFKGRVRWRL
jgi:hypothetical protein